MEFKLGTLSIAEIGNFLSDKLYENGISEKAMLNIYINEEEFKKVDEDLFYRNKKDDNDEFVPSEGEININFDHVEIIIKEKDNKKLG